MLSSTLSGYPQPDYPLIAPALIAQPQKFCNSIRGVDFSRLRLFCDSPKDNEVQKISYQAHRPTYFTTIILSSVATSTSRRLRTQEATTALLCRLNKGCLSVSSGVDQQRGSCCSPLLSELTDSLDVFMLSPSLNLLQLMFSKHQLFSDQLMSRDCYWYTICCIVWTLLHACAYSQALQKPLTGSRGTYLSICGQRNQDSRQTILFVTIIMINSILWVFLWSWWAQLITPRRHRARKLAFELYVVYP